MTTKTRLLNAPLTGFTTGQPQSARDMFSLPRLPFELPGFSLPITVPGRIRQRFVSFLLQRFLGHLVKPGQLDASQIDAQIGGGIVEIKRIELDEQVCPLILLVSGTGFIHV